MLDMGFLPDIRRILRHIPTKRQTLFFSATMPPPIAALARDMLHNRWRSTSRGRRRPRSGSRRPSIRYRRASRPRSSSACSEQEINEALVFTRTKHRANRLADHLVKAGIKTERIHGNRSQPQRTQALAGFKSGRYRVLVATDIAARGIDVVGLPHVVNFDVPAVPDDYVHRVGRTGRAEAVGSAFTFVAPDEESDLQAIERAIGRRLLRVTLPDFDYTARPQALEVPLAQRIAEIRQRKRQERERGQARRDGGNAPRPQGPGTREHRSFGPRRRPR